MQMVKNRLVIVLPSPNQVNKKIRMFGCTSPKNSTTSPRSGDDRSKNKGFKSVSASKRLRKEVTFDLEWFLTILFTLIPDMYYLQNCKTDAQLHITKEVMQKVSLLSLHLICLPKRWIFPYLMSRGFKDLLEWLRAFVHQSHILGISILVTFIKSMMSHVRYLFKGISNISSENCEKKQSNVSMHQKLWLSRFERISFYFSNLELNILFGRNKVTLKMVAPWIKQYLNVRGKRNWNFW